MCSNCKEIILSLPGKAYARVLERRIQLIVEPWIQEELFMGVCSVYMCFVGLEKVFNHVWGTLWRVLWEYAFEGILLRVVSVWPEEEFGLHRQRKFWRVLEHDSRSGLGSHLCCLQLMLSCCLHWNLDLQNALGQFADECDMWGWESALVLIRKRRLAISSLKESPCPRWKSSSLF